MTDGGKDPRLARRALVLKLAGTGAGAATLAGCIAPPRPTVPPPAPNSSGPTDRDPADPPGGGRGFSPAGRPRTGLTDADASDGAGYGRGVYRRTRTGCTDADPNDGPGYGRCVYRRQVSDSDPRDAPGRGRGW